MSKDREPQAGIGSRCTSTLTLCVSLGVCGPDVERYLSSGLKEAANGLLDHLAQGDSEELGFQRSFGKDS